jgi:hypothetical protein
MHGIHTAAGMTTLSIDDTVKGEKCGLPVIIELTHNYDRLSAGQKAALAKIQAPETSKSLISPSGFFRINYDDGTYAPNYDASLSADENAMLAAEAFDSAYAYEVDYLGFPPPPRAGAYYNVFLTNASPYYGWTDTNGLIEDEKYYSYITIDNDFSGSNFYTHGKDAMRVTAAHEFHHAIQIGNYCYPEYDSDIFFLELTSVSMEEFVFNDVNDYYNYIKNYFSAPYKNFMYTKGSGYDLGIWNIFLHKKYGFETFNIIKRQWELFPGRRAMEAIALGLMESGTTFKNEFAEFAVWNYFTGTRANPAKYYEEGANYPMITPLRTTSTIPYSMSLPSVQSLSANYLYFDTQQTMLDNDTLAVIITNCDIDNGIANNQEDLSYVLSGYSYDGETLSVNSSISSSNNAFWTLSYVYNNLPLIPSALEETKIEKPFPNPYKYAYAGSGIEISIPINNPKTGVNINLYVYTVSGKLVYSGVKSVTPFMGTYIVKWNGLSDKGEKLPSGIYIYAAEMDGDIYKGKVAIINE